MKHAERHSFLYTCAPHEASSTVKKLFVGLCLRGKYIMLKSNREKLKTSDS